MRKAVIGIGLLLVCILLVGGWMWFRQNRNVRVVLSEAESLMTEYPDSLPTALQGVKYPEYSRGSNEALCALLLTPEAIAAGKSDNYKRQDLIYYYFGKLLQKSEDVRLNDDNSVIKNENDRLKIEIQSRKIAILVAILSAGFLAFVFYYYRSNRIKRRYEQIIHIKDMLLAKSASQLQQKSNELLRHKQIVQEKEQELFSLEKQQQELKEKMFKMDKVVRKIELVRSMNDGNKARAKNSLVLSGQELDNLLSVINSYYDDFVVRLQQEFSALTQDDIYVCCLLRMEVSNRDIMVLLDINEVALKKRKYRIKREKMELVQASISLGEFLLSY